MSRLKLLSRREIDVERAKDQQKEIAEGIKLAKRVDNLRELTALEEKGLQDFRVKTLTAIQAEIDPKLRELERLEEELKIKRDERAALMVPLTAAWEGIEEDKRDISAKFDEMAEQKAYLQEVVSFNIRKEQENERERVRITDEHIRTSENLSSSELLREESQQFLAEAQEKSDIMNKEAELRIRDMSAREVKLLVREQKVLNKEQNIQDYEARLFRKDLEIRERWKILLEQEQDNGKSKHSHGDDITRGLPPR